MVGALTLCISSWATGNTGEENLSCREQLALDKGGDEMKDAKENKPKRLRPPCSVCSTPTRDTGKVRPSESMPGKNVHIYFCDYCKAEREGLSGEEYMNNDLVQPREPDDGK